jgi:hypothetical protein
MNRTQIIAAIAVSLMPVWIIALCLLANMIPTS